MTLSLARCLPVLFALAPTVLSLPQGNGGVETITTTITASVSASSSSSSLSSSSAPSSTSSEPAPSSPSTSSPSTSSTPNPSPTPISPNKPPCNNSPHLCPRPYNNITHMGAHNAAFLRDASTGYSIAGNQFHNATASLSAGIRLLQAQVHLRDNVPQLCHTSCTLLDAGPLQTWLVGIKGWMDDHPHEVVTLLLVNIYHAGPDRYAQVFEASGLDRYGFIPELVDERVLWPTLQEMIDSNHRLVIFITNIPSPSPSYPYLLPEFSSIFETPYDITSPSEFTCTLDRPSTYPDATSALEAGMLPLLNHFSYMAVTDGITIPDLGNIDSTNGADAGGRKKGALGWHAGMCETEWAGRKPVFVLVDFWDKGGVLEVGDRMNGVEGMVVGRVRVDEKSAAGRVGMRSGLGMAVLVGFVVGVLAVV